MAYMPSPTWLQNRTVCSNQHWGRTTSNKSNQWPFINPLLNPTNYTPVRHYKGKEKRRAHLASVLVSVLLDGIAQVGLALDALDPLGIDPHSLDALLHSSGDARLGSALEKLLRLITLLISGQLKQMSRDVSRTQMHMGLRDWRAAGRLGRPEKQLGWRSRWAEFQSKLPICSPSYPEIIVIVELVYMTNEVAKLTKGRAKGHVVSTFSHCHATSCAPEPTPLSKNMASWFLTYTCVIHHELFR